MRFFDLSQPLFDDCPNCPVHPPVECKIIADHAQDDWRMELLRMASHTGTHLDAPMHKLAGGQAIDAFPLEWFTGTPRLADFTDSEPSRAISAGELQERLPGNLRDCIVLLNTGWGLRRAKTEVWLRHSPFLAPDGAEWLVGQGIKGVGIDHYSIGGSREPDNARTHTILLSANVWIVEELLFPPAFKELPPGMQFMALPIFLKGASGAPCRAVLVH